MRTSDCRVYTVFAARLLIIIMFFVRRSTSLSCYCFDVRFFKKIDHRGDCVGDFDDGSKYAIQNVVPSQFNFKFFFGGGEDILRKMKTAQYFTCIHLKCAKICLKGRYILQMVFEKIHDVAKKHTVFNRFKSWREKKSISWNLRIS